MPDPNPATEKPAISDADMLARFQNSKKRPPCSQTLGMQLSAVNQAEKTIEMAFEVSSDFANPTGAVQGGFVSAMLDEAIMPFLGLGTVIHVESRGDGPIPELNRQAEILYGVKNFIENAVGFANAKVDVSTTWTDKQMTITIIDDGPGFDPAILGNLGEPYVSGREETYLEDPDDKAGGLGLGFFIAKTLIERTGGRVKFGNNQNHGAFVKLIWPRSAFDARSFN